MITKKTQIIILSVVVWSLYILLPLLIIPIPSHFFVGYAFYIKMYFLMGFLSIGFYYFNYYVAIPKYYIKKQYWQYIVVIAGSVFAFFIIARVFKLLFATELSRDTITSKLMFTNFLLRFLLIFMTSYGISFYNRFRQMQSEKTQAELQALKNQINPHFLFNILNDLYGQAITKSEHTAENISRLSSMMRYVLTEAQAENVSLEKEVEYLQSYIELQTRRLTDKTKVDFRLDGNIANKYIPPLLLINFIENAFKHGVSTERNSSIFIRIYIKANTLVLEVKNDILKKSAHDSSAYGGIENTRKRLDLLYPDNYTLNITTDPGTFYVNLLIRIS